MHLELSDKQVCALNTCPPQVKKEKETQALQKQSEKETQALQKQSEKDETSKKKAQEKEKKDMVPALYTIYPPYPTLPYPTSSLDSGTLISRGSQTRDLGAL